MVKLVRDGVEVQLSKRAGNIVTLADILDEVDPDVARMTFLLAGHRLARRRSTSTSSRRSRWRTPSTTCSTRTRGSRRSRAAPPKPGSTRRPLDVGRPRAARRTSARPSCCARSRCIPTSSPTRPRPRAPQKVTTWVRDFARAFHGFYRDCRVITDDAELTQARLWLAEACRIGLANALGLLGVSAPDEMARLDDDDDADDDASTELTVSDAPFDLTLLPASARRRRRREPLGRRRRPRRPRRPSSARRCTSTTRTSCATGAASTAPASATASRTRARRSSARRWRGSSPRRGSTSTSRPAASCTSRCTPGFPAERIVFHGNNKSTDELRAAVDAGVGRIVVDSFDELDRLERSPTRARPTPAVLVRVTPGVEAHTHEFIETGTDDSKFGFGLQNGDALRAVRARRRAAARCGSRACTATSARRCSGSTRSRPRSIAWSGSCSTVETRDRRDRRRAEPRRRARRSLRRRPTKGASIAQYAAALQRDVREGARRARGAVAPDARRSSPAGRSRRRPGSRSTRSARSRTIPGVRTYVAVDGGMSDNLRPVTYGASYEAFLPGAGRRAAAAGRDGRGQALRAGRRARARRAASRPMSRWVTSSRPRSPAPTRTRWRRTTTRSSARRWCSCATAPPGSWCAERVPTTSCASTSLIATESRPGADSADPRQWRAWCATTTDLVRVGILGCGNVGTALVRPARRERRPDHAPLRRAHRGRRASRCRTSRRSATSRSRPVCSPTTPSSVVADPRRRRDRRDDRRGRARPFADPHRAEVGQAGRDREQGAARERRRGAVRGRGRPRASTCCSRRRSRAASR